MVFVGLCGVDSKARNRVAKLLQDLLHFEIVRSGDAFENENSSSTTCSVFPELSVLVDHVTEHWQQHFVLPEVKSIAELDMLTRRPFFLLVSVQDISDNRCSNSSTSSLLTADSIQLFARSAIVLIHNASDAQLHSTLLTHFAPQKLAALARPDWDDYFMQIAAHSARRTNCMKRAVGAVLVRDKTVIATGYNGTARGTTNCMAGGCARCNCVSVRCGQALDSCLCLHAEENAIIEAGRTRAHGATLYTTLSPCLSCAKKICQVGIERVVYGHDYAIEHFSAKLLEEAGIRLHQYEGNILYGTGPISLVTGNCAAVNGTVQKIEQLSLHGVTNNASLNPQ